MATAYGTLANKGVKIKPITYVRVTDANGNVLLENEPLKTKVIDEGVAYIITDMLKSVVKAGTGTSANFNMAVAGGRYHNGFRGRMVCWIHAPTMSLRCGWETMSLQIWALAEVPIQPDCGARLWRRFTRTCR